jgi:hypothetical protein
VNAIVTHVVEDGCKSFGIKYILDAGTSTPSLATAMGIRACASPAVEGLTPLVAPRTISGLSDGLPKAPRQAPVLG